MIVIDELADLMMTSGKEVESAHRPHRAEGAGGGDSPRARDAAAAGDGGDGPDQGEHAVQDRVPRQQRGWTRRIVLDMNGAEVLLGQGDMLYLANGASKPTRCQGTYIDDNEVQSEREAGEAAWRNSSSSRSWCRSAAASLEGDSRRAGPAVRRRGARGAGDEAWHRFRCCNVV